MQISPNSSLSTVTLAPRDSEKKAVAVGASPLASAKPGEDSFEVSRAEPPASYAQPSRSAPVRIPDDAQPLPSSETPLQRTFNDKDREALLQAWGSQSGDSRYSTDYDLDGDGRINAADLAILLGSYAAESKAAGGEPLAAPTKPAEEPAPEASTEASASERVLAAWNKRAGEEGFDASLDANGDGVINSADLAAALGGQTSPTAPVQQPAPRVYTSGDLDQLLKSWGARPGDQRFQPEYDFDADGVISAFDLAQLLGRLAEQKQGESSAAIQES
jgi:Ca2+-binding EF-hand superfamily protein